MGMTSLTRHHWNESPYGPAQGAAAAGMAAFQAMNQYPDPRREPLIEALATHWRVDTDQVAVGNGSDELILLSSLVVGDKSAPGLIGSVTFPGYRNCLALCDRPYMTFDPDVLEAGGDGFTRLVRNSGIVFICNPNNPTGGVLSKRTLDVIVDASRRFDVPVIFDEAYMEFTPVGTPSAMDHLHTSAPITVLRTFSKAYGMAGLRIGYATGHRKTIERLRSAQRAIPFSVSAMGQASALAAIGDVSLIPRVRAENIARREDLCQRLAALGIGFLPSHANFVSISADRPKELAEQLRTHYGILVREIEEYGLPRHLRVSIGTESENIDLIKALDELKHRDLE